MKCFKTKLKMFKTVVFIKPIIYTFVNTYDNNMFIKNRINFLNVYVIICKRPSILR